MKDRSLFSTVGIIIWIITSAVDKFVYKIPNPIYIVLAVIGLALIIAGFIKDRKINK
ncbi:MAG: hypothetical protein IKT34_01085 [Clostridia bacterium]|nr:hypothetical protein [Clostridia bacterium]